LSVKLSLRRLPTIATTLCEWAMGLPLMADTGTAAGDTLAIPRNDASA
jgi:hypothetical protein